ncbi:MAG: hypothetical protein ABI861_13800 [Panacibacter sp.]
MIIKELKLLSSDIKITKAFYQGKMGCAVLKEKDDHISFKTGNSILTFNFTDTYTAPFYHIAFSIPNNKFTEAAEWILQRRSVLPYSTHELVADFKGWNAKAFYFHDDQQNILEFITHFDLGTNDENAFSSNSVERICEIGIVADNVPATCGDIISQCNIPYFTKGPLMEDFAVMGDSNGMLIISKTGRGWVPTQRPAEKFPVKIIAEVNGVDKELSFD